MNGMQTLASLFGGPGEATELILWVCAGIASLVAIFYLVRFLRSSIALSDGTDWNNRRR
jgi:hypothetical protein